MKALLIPAAVCLSWASLCAAEKPIVLWPDGTPAALGTAAKDIPTLTPYFPAKPSGAAMLLIPGGSYSGIYEGQAEPFALWLNEEGITVFVLRYRLGSAGYRYPAQLQDAVEAMRQIRGSAEKWKIDPQHIGVMGFSAGGHLVSTLINRPEDGILEGLDYNISTRPDLAILCYPVISMITKPHATSRKMLIGDKPSGEFLRQTSSEFQVKPGLPPRLPLAHDGRQDGSRRTRSALCRCFAQAWRPARVASLPTWRPRHRPHRHTASVVCRSAVLAKGAWVCPLRIGCNC